jgi:hypothetical protein
MELLLNQNVPSLNLKSFERYAYIHTPKKELRRDEKSKEVLKTAKNPNCDDV